MSVQPTRDVTVEFDSRGRREKLLLWPKSFRRVSTIEYIRMPQDMVGTVHDRSTWARLGVTVQNTVVQPGWQGFLTLEITNHSWAFRVIRRGEALAQILMHRLEVELAETYDGRYQDQARGPQPARP